MTYFGFLSRCMTDVSVRSEAALISYKKEQENVEIHQATHKVLVGVLMCNIRLIHKPEIAGTTVVIFLLSFIYIKSNT